MAVSTLQILGDILHPVRGRSLALQFCRFDQQLMVGQRSIASWRLALRREASDDQAYRSGRWRRRSTGGGIARCNREDAVACIAWRPIIPGFLLLLATCSEGSGA